MKWLFALILLFVTAQAELDFSFAAVRLGNVWVYAEDGNGTRVTDTSSIRYTHLTWSPDGEKLAFIATPLDNQSRQIMLYTAAGGLIELLNSETFIYGLGFSADSDSILYSTAKDRETMPHEPVLKRLATEPGATPVDLNIAIPYDPANECGVIGPIHPAFSLYVEDKNYGADALIVETPYGLLYGGDCFIGATYLIDPASGEITEFANVVHTVISPDQRYLAARHWDYLTGSDHLVVIDLENREVRTVEDALSPEDIVWTPDGSALYYSHHEIVGTLFDGMKEDEVTAFHRALEGLLILDEFMDVYSSTIYHVDLESGENTVVYESDSFGITNLATFSDRLIFSQTDNSTQWVRNIASGKTVISSWDDYDESKKQVKAHLMAFDFSSGHVAELADELKQVTISVVR